MKKIAVIGSLNVDYAAAVDHIPAAGETILSDGLEIIPGGKGANQAFALGKMGAPVLMFGAVGKDANGDLELESLKTAGVDISPIARVDDATGLAMISVAKDGDNSIVVVQGANLQVTPAYIDTHMEALKSCDIIIFQLEIPLETVLYAAESLHQMGKTIILDPAPAPSHLPDCLFAHVDYIKPNENELEKLTGIPNVKSDPGPACKSLLDKGVGCVLASLGSQGVYVALPGGESRLFGVEKVPVVDTTAAGDSFTAATAYALANGKEIFQAVQFANQVATLVVQRKGAQTSIPGPKEIQALWDNFFGT